MPSEVIHFGDFELDPGAFELRRSGRVVRLERIPLELLLFLAEQRGQLVTRDEILERIWGKDVFVDAHNGINTAVRKVRSALKEDPDNPRFLRTVPGKGYRFVADVSSITPRARIASASSLEVAPLGSVATTTGNVRRWAVQPTLATASAPIEIPLSQESKMSGPVDQQETPRRKSLLKRGYVVAAIALLLLICVAIRRGQPRIPAVANVVRITNDRKPKIPMNLPVTDGVHLYFVEGAPWTSGSGIAQTLATGGETTWITTTLQKVLAIYSISPDYSALLVASGVAVGADVATGRSDLAAELWVQPLPAGAPRR
jgi:DNA-binding winged helix-turn-helix (wHTH) protein